MLEPQFSHSVFRPKPSPRWYVTNGDLTVGPVDTGLLIRGVTYGRVPEYCYVRAAQGDWRQLLGVREIRALHGGPEHGPNLEQLAEWGRYMQRVRDEDELCHIAAWLSLVSTGAEAAMFHYASRHGRTLFTRAILGPVSIERFGHPLSEFDLVLRSARRGIPVQSPPCGIVEQGLKKRLAMTDGRECDSVAMIPLFVGAELTAMVEIARAGHAFRWTDLQRIERILLRALRARAA